MPAVDLRDRITGVLLGTALGDSLGLPMENMSPTKIAQPVVLQQRFWFGRGVVSDDTEHAMLVAASLLEAGLDDKKLIRVMARKFRWWFAALPPGVGWATARACLRLWVGISPARSGVFSAGNGPAVRSGLFGALGLPSAQRCSLVATSTRITHSDPRALWAAQAIADVVAMEFETVAVQAALLDTIAAVAPDEEWQKVCVTLRDHLERGSDAATYAAALGQSNGVTGYALHSAPVALFCWLRYRPDFSTAMAAALQLGGDTDSVGAMVGAMAGASIGAAALPTALIDTIVDWPISVALIRRTGDALATGDWRDDAIRRRRRWCFWPGHMARNVVVFAACIVHLLWRTVAR